ncbi:MAG: methyltransferase [Flavisolibacter sp.]
MIVGILFTACKKDLQGNEPSLAKIRDLQMLLITGGKERTVTEYRTLLQGAGLRLSNVYTTTSPLSIIEAVRE